MGHEQTSRHVHVMSDIPLKADINWRALCVRFVPQADIAAVLLAQSMEYQRLAIPYLGAGEVYRQNSLVVVHRTIIGSCQRPIRSDFAASAASASAGSGGSFGFAHPCRTIQVERSVPETAQRAVNDFCSPGSGKSQTTARARTSRLNAVFAAAPQGQFLPCLSWH